MKLVELQHPYLEQQLGVQQVQINLRKANLEKIAKMSSKMRLQQNPKGSCPSYSSCHCWWRGMNQETYVDLLRQVHPHYRLELPQDHLKGI